MEEYFVSDPFEEASSSGVFNLSANGGSMGFRTSDGSEYTSGIYGYTLEEGESLNNVMGTEFVVSMGAIALGVGFSAAVGIIFGWAPARKASKLNPIDALRSM